MSSQTWHRGNQMIEWRSQQAQLPLLNSGKLNLRVILVALVVYLPTRFIEATRGFMIVMLCHTKVVTKRIHSKKVGYMKEKTNVRLSCL